MLHSASQVNHLGVVTGIPSLQKLINKDLEEKLKDNKIYNTALYCRLSLDDGSVGESGSIKTQKIILEEYAKIHGFKIYDVYVDDGYSGLNFNRPGFQRMIQDIQGGRLI